jgi:hypothetical protein
MSNSSSKDIIDSMKSALEWKVEEWVGFHIPDEGSEDYDRWQNMLRDIEDVESISDVQSFIEGGMGDFDDFLICGEWDISDMVDDPKSIPWELVVNTAEEIASQQWECGSWSNVYKYGKWFVSVNEVECGFHKDAKSAFTGARISLDSQDYISYQSNDHNYGN